MLNKINYLKLLSLLPLIFSILLFLYIFYRSEFYYEGERFNYYLKYYLISIIFILLSFPSFFFKKEVQINLYIIFFSSLIMVYFIEAYLVMNNYSNGKKIVTKTGTLTKDGKFSYRDRLDVYKKLKKEGQKVAVTLPPRNFTSETNQKIFAFSGISKIKTIYCNENGYFSIFQSDRYGFNNQDSEWDKANIEYLLIGDSHTFGACVNQSDNIAGNLQKKISKEKGIINLGYSANGPLIELATLREYLPLIKAQRVLWIYYPNDIIDLRISRENNILFNYLNNKKYSQKLHLKQNKIDENLNQKLLQEVIFQSKFGRQGKLKKFIKLTNLRKMTIEYIVSKATVSTIDPRDIDLLVKEFKQILSYANDLDIPLIDVNKEFQNYENPLELWPNATLKYRHLNELGYEKTTDIIFKKILEFENY